MRRKRVSHPSPEDKSGALIASLSLHPRDPALFRTALNHRSVLGDFGTGSVVGGESNERLEFLGDAILGALIGEELYRRYPDAPEGLLTTRRAALVRTEQLVVWARRIDLGHYLQVGTGETLSDRPRDRVLAGAFEALLAAIYLDGGSSAAAAFLQPFLDEDLDPIVASLQDANPKGRLQELTQERYRYAPVYTLESQEGPAHARTFITSVRVNDILLGTGSGPSKRVSEEGAAQIALHRLLADPMMIVAAEPGSDTRVVGQ